MFLLHFFLKYPLILGFREAESFDFFSSAMENEKQVDKLLDAILANDEKRISSMANPSIINGQSEDGYTPLYFACMKGVNLTTIQLLLRMGVTVDLKGLDRETPLFVATHNNFVDAVKALLAAGASVNEENGMDNGTVVHCAARYGYSDLLAIFLKQGANINPRTSHMETPLFLAAKAGRHDTVYQLLINNANRNLANEDGKNPLYIASESQHKHVVIVLKAEEKYLKEAKAAADVEVKMRAPTMDSTEEMAHKLMVKAAKEKAAKEKENAAPQAKKKEAPPPPPKKMEPLPITKIEVPVPIVRTHDPMTGKAYGPCKTLEEVGYDLPPPIPKSLNLKPVVVQRVGGTMMVVGTGTDMEPVVPKMISMIPDPDAVDFSGIIMPASPKKKWQ